jgi:hypothetical protein
MSELFFMAAVVEEYRLEQEECLSLNGLDHTKVKSRVTRARSDLYEEVRGMSESPSHESRRRWGLETLPL